MQNQSLTRVAGAWDSSCRAAAVLEPDTEPLSAAYRLSPEQATFFKREAGIEDDDDLRSLILKVQEKAYEIFPWVCIRSFMFLQTAISSQPEYERIIRLGKERPDGILLDIGCCFGVDARKAVADGFPLKNVVTSDLKTEFFYLGHALFNTTPETYPIRFVPGDVLDSDILQIVPPFDKPPSTERPDLWNLTSLNPLAGRCAVIYAGNFFHVFLEEDQLHLAKALAGLLSPEPGSTICGEHRGNQQKGIFHEEVQGKGIDMFCHCPESWSAMWDEVFGKGNVKVDVRSEQIKLPAGPLYLRMQWSVVRL